MKSKFTLELDALRVESFDTAPIGHGGGTVHGHAAEGETAERPAQTNVRADCGSLIDACASRDGGRKESCLDTCAACATRDAACGTQPPRCPSGPIC